MATDNRIPTSTPERDACPEARVGAERQAIPERATIALSRADSLCLAQALINPPEPNDELRAALRAHQELIAG